MTRALTTDDVIYFWDPNNRHYAERAGGFRNMSGAPIYRRHFRPVRITQITPRAIKLAQSCWLHGKTITSLPRDRGKWPAPSISAVGGFFVVGQDEVDRWCWLEANVRAIADAVGHCDDVDALKTIARMLGVAERKETE